MVQYTKEKLDKTLYKELQKVCKRYELDATGKKVELIERILDFQTKNPSKFPASVKRSTTVKKTDPETTTTNVPQKRTMKKVEKKEESESESESSSEEEVVQPAKKQRVTTTKKSITKTVKDGADEKKAPSSLKRKERAQEEEESESDDEKDDSKKNEPAVVPDKSSTTTTTTTTKTTKPTVSKKPSPKSKYPLKQWLTSGTCHYYLSEYVSREKVMAFDMDDTLIHTKSGNTFAVNRNDWKWLDDSVPEKLKKLYKEDGYQIVIFTNQGGIKSGSKYDQSKFKAVSGKINDLEEELGIPLVAFMAADDDAWRKPNLKMWQFMSDECTDGNVAVDISQSFYIGDAAGRPKGWKAGREKDFSSSDRGFAMAVGLQFQTPEEFFLGEAPYNYSQNQETDPDVPFAPRTGNIIEGGGEITRKKQEIVISVGYPGSGKSTLAKKYFEPAGYVIVNRDTLKTQDKCAAAVKLALSSGKSVIVDATHPTVANRAKYIELGKEYKVNIRCLRFTTSYNLSMHLNYFRERKDSNNKHVSQMVYNKMRKDLEEPSTSEGFNEVNKVNLILDLDPSEESLYNVPCGKKEPKTKV
eukprot:gene4718-5892_t